MTKFALVIVCLAVSLEAWAEPSAKSDFVYWAAGQSPAVARKGTQWEFLATREQTGGAYALLEITAQAGRAPPLHRHPPTEGFYVLEGTYEFIRGKERTVATKGTFITIPSGVEHRWRNIGTTTGRILCLIVPGGMEGLFVEMGEPVSNRVSPPGTQAAKNVSPEVISKKYGVEMLETPRTKELPASSR